MTERRNKNRGYRQLIVWQDALAYKLENGLLRLVESLERKRNQDDWIDTLIVEESNAAHG